MNDNPTNTGIDLIFLLMIITIPVIMAFRAQKKKNKPNPITSTWTENEDFMNNLHELVSHVDIQITRIRALNTATDFSTELKYLIEVRRVFAYIEYCLDRYHNKNVKIDQDSITQAFQYSEPDMDILNNPPLFNSDLEKAMELYCKGQLNHILPLRDKHWTEVYHESAIPTKNYPIQNANASNIADTHDNNNPKDLNQDLINEIKEEARIERNIRKYPLRPEETIGDNL
jgi:hypothetical protein